MMYIIGKAAKRGILIKNAEILERASSLNVLIIDKTGTLTEGKPEVTDFIHFNEIDKKELLEIIMSLENYSGNNINHG